jgi:hypothetical protein
MSIDFDHSRIVSFEIPAWIELPHAQPDTVNPRLLPRWLWLRRAEHAM